MSELNWRTLTEVQWASIAIFAFGWLWLRRLEYSWVGEDAQLLATLERIRVGLPMNHPEEEERITRSWEAVRLRRAVQRLGAHMWMVAGAMMLVLSIR